MAIPRAAKSLKQKTCKECGKKFTPLKPLQSVCDFKCAVLFGIRKMAKDEEKRKNVVKRELREQKEKLKTRQDWLKEAQKAFNAWIRCRDKNDACISCTRWHTGQYHAGHYRTTKAAPELRFNELNVHKQCSVCNNHMSGNIIEYRKYLIEKIGIEKVEWLEGKHEAKHYSIEDLKEIKETYKLKLKEAMKNDAS
jgi:hypothetical protein